MTDPVRPSRHLDNSRLSERIQVLMEIVNTGGRRVNQNARNVPPRYLTYPVRKLASNMADLPAPSDAGVGAHALVLDSQVAHADGIGTIITDGGGTFSVPVYAATDPATGLVCWFIG